jgi:hypothetical protein
MALQKRKVARLNKLRPLRRSHIRQSPLDLQSRALPWGPCCAWNGPDPDMSPWFVLLSAYHQVSIASMDETQAHEQAGGVGVALTQSSVE